MDNNCCRTDLTNKINQINIKSALTKDFKMMARLIILLCLMVPVYGCMPTNIKSDTINKVSATPVSSTYAAISDSVNIPAHGYLVVERVNGVWTVISISELQPSWREGLEIITYPKWEPAYEITSNYTMIKDGWYSCKLNSPQERYTPCVSSLTKFINTDFFFLGGSSRYVFDKARFEKLIQDISKSPYVLAIHENARMRKEKEDRLYIYKTEYISAKNDSIKLEKFIAKYKDNDPENLVQKARERIVLLNSYKKELEVAVASTQSPDQFLKQLTPQNPRKYCNAFQVGSEDRRVCEEIAPSYINEISRMIAIAKWSSAICYKVSSKRINSALEKCKQWATEMPSSYECAAKLNSEICEILHTRDKLNVRSYKWNDFSLKGSL